MHTTLPFLFILLISPILVESSFTPSLTSKSTSAFIDGQYFYILGSTPSSNDKISQAFMINLSTQWDAKTPDFTELSLPTSGLIGNSISSTLTLDQQRWFVVSNNKGYYYDIKLNTWSTSTIKLNGPLGLSTTITNNKDGSISIIDSNNGKRGSIWTLDPNSNNTSSSSLFIHKLSTDKGELIGSSLAAWSNTLSKLILFDSSKLLFTAEINKNNVNAGNSQNNYGFQGHGVTFSPHMFTSACFVPAGNGSKIIYFGGSDVNNKPTGDVSILDTTTWTWNTIRSTDIQKRRVGASCAVSNNQLIIWGGYNSKTAIPNPKEVLIFDLTTNQWIDRYTPPTRINSLPDSTKGLTSETATPSGSIPDPLNQGTNGPAPVASEMSDSNNSSTGPSRATRIGLGVLAVLVVLAIVGAIFLCVRKRKLKKTLRRTQFWDSTGNLPLSAASSVLGVMSRNNKVTPVPPPVATKEQKQEMQQQHLQQQQQQQQQPHNQSQQTIIESPPITPRNSPKENLEYLNVSDTDDASTLNDNPSPLYPPTNFCNDSFCNDDDDDDDDDDDIHGDNQTSLGDQSNGGDGNTLFLKEYHEP
ncbi:hypothetical protein BGZ76_010240 [Entomortierella beljakovae]|nr:hypothetical protein BGZ76_010240 [Entomortierella beljakovae]